MNIVINIYTYYTHQATEESFMFKWDKIIWYGDEILKLGEVISCEEVIRRGILVLEKDG